MLYLTGCSSAETRAARRPDLGLLVTPASGLHAQRQHYLHWAVDNGCFSAPLPDGRVWPNPVPDSPVRTPTARAVRYGDEPSLVDRFVRWLERLDPAGCLFATLPDVVGDYAATWERSARYVARVRRLGFPVAVVLQDGVERDRFVFRSILLGADAVFLGGSTEWKLSGEAAALAAEAKNAGLLVHMGRVNSFKRLAYATEIGCDSADGTYVGFGPRVNTPRVLRWPDDVADLPPPRPPDLVPHPRSHMHTYSHLRIDRAGTPVTGRRAYRPEPR